MSTSHCDNSNIAFVHDAAGCPAMDIGWLTQQLERPGYSQAGLARALGKDPSAVSRILAGDRQIKAKEVPLILQYLGVEAPAPYADEQDYEQALGRAISKWTEIDFGLENLILVAISEPAGSQEGPPDERFHRYMQVMFWSARSHRDRLHMVDQLMATILREHRNEFETWQILSQRVRRAALRRDRHMGAITWHDPEFGLVGHDRPPEEDDGIEDIAKTRLSVTTLIEDAEHFVVLAEDLHVFGKTVRGLG
jgi:transcriptional regulator with XRE-family HTH domain